MEKANLRGEALHEYGALLSAESLTENQRGLVESRIQELRK